MNRGKQFKMQPAAFNQTRDLINKRKKPTGTIYVQSYLRSEVVLGSQDSINFDIMENVNQGGLPFRKSERRLKQSDTFTVTGIGFFIGRCLKLVNGANSGQIIMRTFPNPQVFSGAGEAVELQKIYNGYMQIQRDQTKYYEALPMWNHYCVTEAQQGMAVSTVALTGLFQRDGHFNSAQGFRKIEPTFEINGQSKCEISVKMPDLGAMTSSDVANDNIAVLFLTGLVQQFR